MIDRRRFLAAAGGALAGIAGIGWPAVSRAGDGTAARLATLERDSGGRLGVALFDSGSGLRLDHRGDERFPMCSTFKLLLAAAVLRRVDRGEETLARHVAFLADELVPWSPVTERHAAAGGADVATLCAAAVSWSDNTAANLLLAAIGGPVGFTRHARSLGDTVTRLDRIEPELNDVGPGDVRDTTSPRAMLGSMQRLLLGDALAPASRARLLGWLRATRTGDARLRAGLPAGWEAGDKTGTGDSGISNDIGILWPPGRPPLLACAYLVAPGLDGGDRDAVIAAVGRLAAGLA
ncbi:class A beta-lactamase [Coralloluteibacterium stylophorae]|uniref:Beta-lactamase n=1 Tax=Coralloluteibacterium stylophorae TaxID=1776034 RepID=A0A8J7VSC5_9GAMM|nr:class A beta-lactamase [Coralloluteibacterium stylophorae]MBS7456954.1 class A beta-lactamase [Coralloluteibacterium stylophorae]